MHVSLVLLLNQKLTKQLEVYITHSASSFGQFGEARFTVNNKNKIANLLPKNIDRVKINIYISVESELCWEC